MIRNASIPNLGISGRGSKSENSIPGVYDSEVSNPGLRIQKIQNFEFNVFVQKSVKFHSKSLKNH